jgi:hypothetical protein
MCRCAREPYGCPPPARLGERELAKGVARLEHGHDVTVALGSPDLELN